MPTYIDEANDVVFDYIKKNIVESLDELLLKTPAESCFVSGGFFDALDDESITDNPEATSPYSLLKKECDTPTAASLPGLLATGLYKIHITDKPSKGIIKHHDELVDISPEQALVKKVSFDMDKNTYHKI